MHEDFDRFMNYPTLTKDDFIKIELGVEFDNDRAISFCKKKFRFEVEGARKKLLSQEGEFIDDYFITKML